MGFFHLWNLCWSILLKYQDLVCCSLRFHSFKVSTEGQSSFLHWCEIFTNILIVLLISLCREWWTDNGALVYRLITLEPWFTWLTIFPKSLSSTTSRIKYFAWFRLHFNLVYSVRSSATFLLFLSAAFGRDVLYSWGYVIFYFPNALLISSLLFLSTDMYPVTDLEIAAQRFLFAHIFFCKSPILTAIKKCRYWFFENCME